MGKEDEDFVEEIKFKNVKEKENRDAKSNGRNDHRCVNTIPFFLSITLHRDSTGKSSNLFNVNKTTIGDSADNQKGDIYKSGLYARLLAKIKCKK